MQKIATSAKRFDIKNKIITYSFCESFKDRLLDHIKDEYMEKGSDLSRLAVVFGGKRPALFVKRDLGKHFSKSFYPPKFFTIDEFMKYTVVQSETFSPAQDLDSCFSLYRLARFRGFNQRSIRPV